MLYIYIIPTEILSCSAKYDGERLRLTVMRGDEKK